MLVCVVVVVEAVVVLVSVPVVVEAVVLVVESVVLVSVTEVLVSVPVVVDDTVVVLVSVPDVVESVVLVFVNVVLVAVAVVAVVVETVLLVAVAEVDVAVAVVVVVVELLQDSEDISTPSSNGLYPALLDSAASASRSAAVYKRAPLWTGFDSGPAKNFQRGVTAMFLFAICTREIPTEATSVNGMASLKTYSPGFPLSCCCCPSTSIP